MNEQTIEITVGEYDHLVASYNKLAFLEALGVDNWQGYRLPPAREDFDTEDEYIAAYNQALESY